MRQLRLCALFMLGLLLAAAVSDAAAYTFTTIDVPGTGTTDVVAIGRNGELLAIDRWNLEASFLISKKGYTTIEVPGSTQTQATGISSRGDIVGYFREPDGGTYHGFVLSGGKFTTIDVPGNVG